MNVDEQGMMNTGNGEQGRGCKLKYSNSVPSVSSVVNLNKKS